MSTTLREECKARAKAAVRRNLLNSIECMQGFLDNAKRRVEQGDDLLESISAVQHELAWGMANASSSIESAIGHAKDYLSMVENGP